MQQAAEFYEDEVLEGFYVPSMVKKAWGAQMDVLSCVDAICTRHNIPYFADWGSLLGTIRHGGYVPWDDDLDISMRRKDYDRFLQYAKDELPEGFKVMNYKTQEGHLFFVARIVGKPRICFEKDHLRRFVGFPYIVGLDLFILDNVHKDRKIQDLISKKAEFVIALADQIADGSFPQNEIEENLKLCENYTNEKIDRHLTGEKLRVRMYELAEKLFSCVPDKDSDALVQMMPFGMYGKKLYIPKEYYRDTVRLPYMDTTIPVPICYDAVMRYKFGNYMQIHRKWDGHDYPFFDGQHKDLIKVLDFEYPAYKVCESDFYPRKKCDTEIGARDKISHYILVLEEQIKILGGNLEDSIETQGLAYELGTYIEAVYGEGSKTVGFLEELCESLYRIHEGNVVDRPLEECVIDLKKAAKEEFLSKQEIVFMCFNGKYFKYMKSEYEKYKSDKSYDVKVLAIPYYYKDYDGTLINEQYDLSAYPDDIQVVRYEEYDIKERHPVKIIMNNPFDEWNSHTSTLPDYYSSQLIRYTDELVYIPFFRTYDFTVGQEPDYHNMDYYVNVPGVVNCDKIILSSDKIKACYVEKLLEFANEKENVDLRKYLETKIEVIHEEDDDNHVDKAIIIKSITGCTDEEYSNLFLKPDGSSKKILVYFNSLSILDEKREKTIEKLSRIRQTFKQSKDEIVVLWVPQISDKEDLEKLEHSVLIKYEEELNDFVKKNEGVLITGATRNDYEILAQIADAYYGDPSELAMRFYLKKKAIMLENIDV